MIPMVFTGLKRRIDRALAGLCVCLGLAACGGAPDHGMLALNTDPADGARVHDILVVTTRQKDTRPDTYFGGERSLTASFAKASISVPPTHTPGDVEWPKTPPGNPKSEFVTRAAGYLDGPDAFTRELNARLEKKPKGEREIFLFIHGYNTPFAASLFRFTQLVHDGKIDAVPVVFSWASRGQLTDYIYDLNSAAIARDSLEQTIVKLSRSKADRITILAHSMGNWLLMETARRANPEMRRAASRKIDNVILAAPDIDVDLFKAQLKSMGRIDKPYVVIVSRDDKALRLSRAIAGGTERVGAYTKAEEELTALGAIVIDVTELDALDGANHSKFAQLAEFSPELRKAFSQSGLVTAADMHGAGNVGGDLTSFIGDTLTLPIRIVAAPITAASSSR